MDTATEPMTQDPTPDTPAEDGNRPATAPQGDGTPTPIRGYFQQPLFNTDAIRGLERVGVIDVGSNSVRMVVFDGAARSPAYYFNEKILCGLGRGLAETGLLNPDGR